MTSLGTLPAFLAYLALALGYLAAFLAAYVWVTPYPEWALIRQGNAAASLALSGATLGFCLPLASVISHSVGLRDMALWGLVALGVQVLAFVLLRLVHAEVCDRIARGEMAAGTLVASGSLCVGVLNAACLTY
jgi:putative membrane protein